MRRFTLVVLVALFLLIVLAAALQGRWATNQRGPGPPLATTPAPTTPR